MENGMLAQRRLRDILELEERDSLSLCQIIQECILKVILLKIADLISMDNSGKISQKALGIV